MDKNEIKTKIESLTKEINTQQESIKDTVKTIEWLKAEKAKLKKQLEKIEEKGMTFEQKFAKWWSKSSGEHSTWIPDREEFPAFRELMDHAHLNRYETVNVRDYFDQYWSYILEPDGRAMCEEEEDDYELVVKAAKEVMKANLKSFKFDW